MALSPAVAGSASAAPPVTSSMQDPMGAGGGMPGGDPIQALIGPIREISSQCDAVAQANPDIAPIFQQIKSLLRQAIVQKAQTASMQTPSAQALPMGGQ